METKPVIYGVKMSSQKVNTKTKVTVTIVAEDISVTDVQYARQSNYDLIAGQEIGVI